MATGQGSSGSSTVPARRAFTKGFLVRLLYGSLGILAVVLIRPDLLGENLHLLATSIALYLLVCLAGGASDAAVGRERRVRLLPRRGAADIVALVLLVVALLILWQGR